MQIMSAVLANWVTYFSHIQTHENHQHSNTQVYGTKSEGTETISKHPRTMSIVNLIILAVVTPIFVSLADDGYEDDGVTKKKGVFMFVVL